LSTFPSDEDAGVRPIELDVIEARASYDQLVVDVEEPDAFELEPAETDVVAKPEEIELAAAETDVVDKPGEIELAPTEAADLGIEIEHEETVWDEIEVGWGDQRRARLSAAAYDRENGLLYILELYANEAKPVVHVWGID